MSRPLIAITGATGFVGGFLLQQLHDDNRFDIRALTRRPQPAFPNLEWVAGDLADPSALRKLVENADIVVHLAGLIKARSKADFFSVNRDATGVLVKSAFAAGATGFLHLSSLAARHPDLSDYAASKRAGEALALSNAAEYTVGRVLNLRAPAVYGPGDDETLKLFKPLRWGIAPIPQGSDRVAMIHVEDLASAIIACVDELLTDRENAKVQPIEKKDKFRGYDHIDIDDGTADGHDLQTLYALVAETLGRRPRYVKIPRTVLSIAAILNTFAARIGRKAPILTLGKVNEICFPDWRAKSPHLRELINWQPRHTLADALPIVIAAYVTDGRL
ncbi:MAG: NAD-dependent epimerase/dehydratase family protein [Pseudomonadota bacterium]